MRKIKRTLAYFNPSEMEKAKKYAKKIEKKGIKVVIERHPKWKTLDVRKVIKKKKPKNSNGFKIKLPRF